MTSSDAVFLSALVLVEPGQVRLLEDLLLCLDGQSQQDFDVTLLLGDVSEEEQSAIRELIHFFPITLEEKLRIVDGPSSRAERLNSGVENAKGHYIAPLTADTVLFSRWVEEFSRLVDEAPGAVARIIGVEQAEVRCTWPGGEAGHEAIEGPVRKWALSFDAVGELLEQQSPLGTYAIPTTCFSDNGLRYDEHAVVGDDWELLIRAAMACGVIDSDGEVTALLRRWSGSTGVFEKSARAQARKAVLDRLNSDVLTLPPGAAHAIAELADVADDLRNKVRAAERERDWFAEERNQANSRVEQLLAVVAVNESITVVDVVPDLVIVDALAQAQVELQALRGSTSWKITAPLRRATRLLRKLAGR